MLQNIVLFLLLAGLAPAVQAENFSHGVWDHLLKQNVAIVRNGLATEVNYAGMAAHQAQLKQYLEAMSAVSPADFDKWPRAEQLAFLINAYNAWTVDLILTGYPKITSIKDLGSLFRSPWKKTFIPLLDKVRSLDDIEHGLIRGSGRYHEPRIHFALNCASIGCPALRPEAYVANRLEAQLEDQTVKFLADKTRNRIEDGSLMVSPIFKWYRNDFEVTFQHGNQAMRPLASFFVQYADAMGLNQTETGRLKSGKIAIGFLDYDWRLNDLKK